MLAAAACGSASNNATKTPSVVVRTPVQLVASTADATTKPKTAKMAIAVTVKSPALTRDVTVDMQGALAFDGSRADLTMSLGSILPSVPSDAQVEARLVGGSMYIDMSKLLSSLGGAGQAMPPGLANFHWLKIDASGLTGVNGSDSPSDYTQYLEYLRAASKGGVTTVGHETVRGVATTHYRVLLDPAKIVAAEQKRVDAMPPALHDVLERGIQALEHSTKTIVADVWIDNAGLARRVAMDVPLTIPNAGAATVSVRMELYDFGTKVDVQAPPPSEVANASDLAGLLGSSAS
jgi:hypothetical protein